MKPIVVIGHAALDHIYRVAEFPREPVKIRALEHIDQAGGMASNAAAAIARLGGAAELWSRTGGDDNGARIRALLAQDGVDATWVKVHPGARSSTAAIIVDGHGERLIVGERDHAMSADPSWLPLDHIPNAALVYSDLRWFEATRAAFAEARKHGTSTLIDGDVGGGEHLIEFTRLADYAIFSAPALEELLPGATDGERLDWVLQQGARHAGLTRGNRGYFWRNRAGEGGHQPAFKTAVVDTTGAGDAFHGAFAYALVRGLSDTECARFASAAAALSCRKLGARAGLPTAAEVEAFLLTARPL